MRISVTTTLCSLVATVAAAAGTQAQSTPWEIGVDGGVFHYSYSTDIGGGRTSNTSFTQLQVPISVIRVAFPISPTYAIEPAAGLVYVSGSGNSTTSYSGDVGLLVELSHSRKEPQWFLRPFVGWQHFTNASTTSDRSTFGVGAGVRVPATDRISMRYEARYRYLAKSNGVSGNVIGLLAGVSVFTN